VLGVPLKYAPFDACAGLVSACSARHTSSDTLVPLAALLHDPDPPGSSGVLPPCRESAQPPDSSAETALPIAPTSSGNMAGPPFDSRRLHS
jgi:hypothetical protein